MNLNEFFWKREEKTLSNSCINARQTAYARTHTKIFNKYLQTEPSNT